MNCCSRPYRFCTHRCAQSAGEAFELASISAISAKQKLETLAKKLDYGCINDVPPFDSMNPSAENIAQWFHRELSDAVASENAVVRAITLWEGPVNSVTFRADR